MQKNVETAPALTYFLPSRRALLVLVPLTVALLLFAFYVRYGVIQNTPLGLACDAGEQSLRCTLRITTILLFIRNPFGWVAVAAALFQLWRPNVVVFGVGVCAAAVGIVLYNTRLSSLAVGLLVLSLARARSGTRSAPAGQAER
jgi:membrane-associated phospholipid phosphatase